MQRLLHLTQQRAERALLFLRVPRCPRAPEKHEWLPVSVMAAGLEFQMQQGLQAQQSEYVGVIPSSSTDVVVAVVS